LLLVAIIITWIASVATRFYVTFLVIWLWLSYALVGWAATVIIILCSCKGA
jgi:hypothetical protein